MGVCVSANLPGSASAAEDKAVRCEDLVDSFLVASQALVPRAVGPVGGHPSALPTQSEALEVEPECDVLPGCRVAEVDSVASYQEQLVKKGVPQKARQMVLAAWRPGTIRVYAAQYRVFCRWCRGISKSPTEASIGDVLRFLKFLFDKGLQYWTLCVYRSMLSNVLPPVDGVKVGELRQVVCFLKGVFLSRPPRKMLVPQWDLPLVLRVLEAAPFEPMESASLKLVTFKLTFLLALTTRRRVADISKLAIGDHCRVQKGRVTFLPTSLAKADDPSHFQKEVIVHDFKRERLCPLRAMKWYLKKTEELREQGVDSMNLLRCLTAPFNPPSAQTVSRWLVRTIKMAYDVYPHLPKGKVKAHSVRALAPNWALFKGATKRSILQAADWRRENTFIKH